MKFKPIIVENGANFNTIENGIEANENGMKKNIKNDYQNFSRSLVGTAEYASPEMLNNTISNVLSPDLWSLGCIIYKFFHGKTPFKANSDWLIFDNVINYRLTISKELPEEVQDIIAKLLAYNPDERLGANNDFEELKMHPFFIGVDFKSVHKNISPVTLNQVHNSNSASTKIKSPVSDRSIDEFSFKSSTSSKNLVSDFLSVPGLNLNAKFSSKVPDIFLNKGSPVCHYKRTISSNCLLANQLSDFSFDSYVNCPSENIIEEYIRIKNEKKSILEIKSESKDEDVLLYEGIVKKKSLIMYTNRKLKLFSNFKLEFWDYQKNILCVKYISFIYLGCYYIKF